MKLAGVFVAPVTPLHSEGSVNVKAFEQLLDFLLERGVDGICVGGATSGYPHFDLEERKALVTCAARRIRGKAILLAAIGASTIEKALAIGRHALHEGAYALLLPMPHFYIYQQEDLEAFCREVCRSLDASLLLYNLPSFTNALEIETSIRLLKSEPNLVGIKDSSGDRAALGRLVQERSDKLYTLFIGNDSLFLDALQAGWDGIVSGTANLCPELLVQEYRSFRAGDTDQARWCQQELDAIIAQAGQLPFPWGIRIGLEMRGISAGPVPLPLSHVRKEQAANLREWFSRWLQDYLPGSANVHP